jgi:hypothetical protein
MLMAKYIIQQLADKGLQPINKMPAFEELVHARHIGFELTGHPGFHLMFVS